MIPNNQFWFNNKANSIPVNPDSGKVMNYTLMFSSVHNMTSLSMAWRDGPALAYFDGK